MVFKVAISLQTTLHKLITLVVIATSPNLSHFLAFTATFHCVTFSTVLEQLLKYQLGVWVAPTTNFTL